MADPLLFSRFTLRGMTLRNRIVIPPMCQYQAIEGAPQDWHMVHLGRFAIGGAGLVIAEMTAIEPRGRITHGCSGLWNDDQGRAWSKIAEFIKSNGAAAGIQLAHAGRKASLRKPWEGAGPLTEADAARSQAPWRTVAPSAAPFADWPTPHALSVAELAELLVLWRQAAQRAVDAGFDVVEIHGAHGYLIHEFLSPLSNLRNDGYGGDPQGRMRFPLEVVETVRAVLPRDKPLFVRISASEWVDGGFSPEESVIFSREMKARGVDVVHVSSGGNVPAAPPVTLGYQAEFARQIRRQAEIPTVAVGAILTPAQAELLLQDGAGDLIGVGRASLADPNWPVRAKQALDPEGDFKDWAMPTRQVLAAHQALLARLNLR